MLTCARQTLWLSSVSGLLAALSLSGRDFFWIAWFAWAPLLWAVAGCGWRNAVAAGFLSGAVQAACMLHWIPGTVASMGSRPGVGALLLFLLCLVQGAVVALSCCLVRLAVHSAGRARPGPISDAWFVLAVAAVWVAVEYAFVAGLPALPWLFFQAGYSQWGHPALIQVAAVAGVCGVSFVVLAVNAGLVRALARRSPAPLAAAAVLLLASATYGRIRLAGAPEGGSVRVAVLQGNISPRVRMDAAQGDAVADSYRRLARRANEAGAELAVWTESAIPWPLGENDDLVGAVLEITRPSGTCHLVGAPVESRREPGKFLNAVLAVLPDGRATGQYAKRRPLILAETPLRAPGALRTFKLHPGTADFVRGASPGVLATPAGAIGITICNENFYADLVRASVRDGARWLANVTNDGWLRGNTPLRQHFLLNPFRAVENDRAMIVANNVGVSALVDARGRVRARSGMRAQECLAGSLPEGTGHTLYTRFGDWFAKACAISAAGLVVMKGRDGRRVS